MNDNLVLAILLLAATCCTLFMTALSWWRREYPIAVVYGLSMLASSFYTLGYAFELLSHELESIRFWLRIEYIGIAYGPSLWMMMVLQYTGLVERIRPKLLLPMLIVPTITLIGHYTNDWTHAFYTWFSLLQQGDFTFAISGKGPLYELHVIYNYTLVIIGLGLLVQMLVRAKGMARRPIVMVLIGSLIAYSLTFVYVAGFLSIPLDLSPFGLVFSGIFYLWGIYQFNMLRLAPLALRRVFASMQDAVLLFGPDDRLVGFNPAARRVFPDVGSRQIGFRPQAVFQGFSSLVELMQKEEFKGRVASEHDQHYEARLSVLYDRLHRPVGRMLTLIDVGEAVRAERQILADTEKLARLNAFKDKMFQVIAHDLRDPLAVLVNLSELLEEEQQGTEGSREIVEEMGRQVRNTFTLAESLLDWLRTQGGSMTVHPIEQELAAAVERQFQFLRHRSSSKQLTLRAFVPPEAYVYADKETLDLVLRNLLSNAVKFTEQGGQIEVRARSESDRWIVAVHDTGAGLSSEQAGVLLREMYPVSETGTAGERGAGLGLSLCRSFLRLNGGDLWFESTHRLGSTFYFSLPAWRVPEEGEGGLR